MGFCPLSLESLYISNIGLLFVEYIANIFPQIAIYLWLYQGVFMPCKKFKNFHVLKWIILYCLCILSLYF